MVFHARRLSCCEKLFSLFINNFSFFSVSLIFLVYRMNCDCMMDYMKRFAEMDLSKDGVLDLEEFCDYLHLPLSEEVKTIFRIYDIVIILILCFCINFLFYQKLKIWSFCLKIAFSKSVEQFFLSLKISFEISRDKGLKFPIVLFFILYI